ncbi:MULTISPECIES: iron-containing redox enzyme family protein [Streptosporangium]|uniref:Iron-containing redox enzyme family protein n=1 Tax=Streptosporangium jomthongense TaxID=1193683 RepID=A0ABV8FB01_9ACTN
MSVSVELALPRCADALNPRALVEIISSWLHIPATELDLTVNADQRRIVIEAVRTMNELAGGGDSAAFHQQQLLLSRLYGLVLRLPQAVTAEGSVVLHEVVRLLEEATLAREDHGVDTVLLDEAPADPKDYLSWLKNLARRHPAYKHPYYAEFIRDRAGREDLRTYVIQESVVDGRFDDLLAMMQVGTTDDAKLEIARNYWDEMGNGDADQVHTHLFNQIFQVFDIGADELEDALTAEALLSGNLAVMLCRYRRLYPEAVGFLGMTEWFAPDRFVQVVHAWERLGLPDVGIVYHRLHITVDSLHAAGWFHNVIIPAAESPAMRRGIARGALLRLNSSARYLDERLAEARSRS